jgi:outer membrane protein OmpA-like peptidoglycan-associated protein
MRYISAFIGCFLYLSLAAQNNTTAIKRVKAADGLDIIAMQLPAAQQADITLWARTGSTFDADSFNGANNIIRVILSQKIQNGINSGKYKLNAGNTGFRSEPGIDNTPYKFTVYNDLLSDCAKLIKDSFSNTYITEQEIKIAIARVEKELEDSKQNTAFNYNEEIYRKLFPYDYSRRNVKGDPEKYKNLDTSVLNTYFRKYYSPTNISMVIVSSMPPLSVFDITRRNTDSWHQSAFDPEVIAKVIDFKPMVYTTQVITNALNGITEFQIYYQLPGVNKIERNSYCAFLLSEMLNDKNNYIQIKARKLGMQDMRVIYQPENYSSVFKIAVRPGSNVFPVMDFIHKELKRMDQVLLTESSLNAAKVQFALDYSQALSNPDFPNQIAKFTTISNDNFFQLLGDSIKIVSESQMKLFLSEYFTQAPNVTGLSIPEDVRIATNADSLFSSLDKFVDTFTFHFRTNVHDIEGSDNLSKLNRLVQWLKINPDVNVQINGFADKGEYLRATDDSIMVFIDSLPTFAKVKPQKGRKPYLQLEMMRAMKIIKYLYDHGIGKDRITGSSSTLTSTNRQQAIDNAKCTLTLNKIKKSVSVYEYHYGKPKPKD